MPRAFVSLTSDFGVQTQGVGAMEGAIRSIAPEANVVHLMHGLPSFDIIAAARTMETVPAQSNVILKDDYGRVEVAKNLGSFVGEHAFKIGGDAVVEMGT